METEFITREDAINAMVRVRERMFWPVDDADTALCGAIDELRKLRPADVRPVVRGKWIKKFMGFPPEPHTLCSCCEYDPDFAVFDLIEYDGCIGLKPFRPNFCPNCGADMREVKSGEK